MDLQPSCIHTAVCVLYLTLQGRHCMSCYDVPQTAMLSAFASKPAMTLLVCLQATLDSAHPMKRMGSMSRTRSANSLNSSDQPKPHPPPGAEAQTPGHGPDTAHQALPSQQRSGQQHKPDQATGPEGSGPEGSSLQSQLSSQGSRGLPTVTGGKPNGHSR